MFDLHINYLYKIFWSYICIINTLNQWSKHVFKEDTLTRTCHLCHCCRVSHKYRFSLRQYPVNTDEVHRTKTLKNWFLFSYMYYELWKIHMSLFITKLFKLFFILIEFESFILGTPHLSGRMTHTKVNIWIRFFHLNRYITWFKEVSTKGHIRVLQHRFWWPQPLVTEK